MKNRIIEFPHPVLSENTRDYLDSTFGIHVLSHEDSGFEIVLELECRIECQGLLQTVIAGDAQTILRLTCNRTSLRETYDLNPSGSTTIRISKQNVTDSIDLQAMVVAAREIPKFKLPEFNPDYFDGFAFTIRKGDILAYEPGLKIKLNTLLEKDMGGIVQVRCDQNAENMRVHYPEAAEGGLDLTDYIVITLPEKEYKNYALMMTKKHFKNEVKRFVQASIVLPAITEAVGRLRMEETTIGDDGGPITHYKGTVWADSIYDALKKYDIADLSATSMSDYEIADVLLGNVTADSINELKARLDDWSTI